MAWVLVIMDSSGRASGETSASAGIGGHMGGDGGGSIHREAGNGHGSGSWLPGQ